MTKGQISSKDQGLKFKRRSATRGLSLVRAHWSLELIWPSGTVARSFGACAALSHCQIRPRGPSIRGSFHEAPQPTPRAFLHDDLCGGGVPLRAEVGRA